MSRAFGPTRVLVLLLALASTAGCRFGDASFDGALGDRSFDPGGTVFTYVDVRDDDLLEREVKPAIVTMTWIAFDPEADLNDLPGSELENYRHELRLRDALALVFDDASALSPGETYESVSEGGSELGDEGLSARVHLAPERLTRGSTYADFAPYGSRRQVTVSLDEARLLEDGALLAGEIVVDVSRGELDPPEVLEGRLEGRFHAPAIEERAAERNLSLLAVDDILGLPLVLEEQP